MDHERVLILDADHGIIPLAPFPLDVRSDEQLVTCAVLHGPAAVASPSSNPSQSRWKTGVMSVVRFLTSLAKESTPSMTTEQPLPRTIHDQTVAHWGGTMTITDQAPLLPESRTLSSQSP